MSNNLTDELFLSEPDEFSIAKIDETIARSKKVVEESLALSNIDKNPFFRRSPFKGDSYNQVNDSDDYKEKSFFDKDEENETRIKVLNPVSQNYQNHLFQKQKKLKELETRDFARTKEIA